MNWIRSKSKRRTRVGKTGTVRLGKKEMTKTRTEIYFRAEGNCEMREILLAELAERNDMTANHKQIAEATITQNCWRWVSLAHGHDAHLLAKRNHGDEKDNRVWSCPPCHIEADHNFYGKPCPPKPAEAL